MLDVQFEVKVYGDVFLLRLTGPYSLLVVDDDTDEEVLPTINDYIPFGDSHLTVTSFFSPDVD